MWSTSTCVRWKKKMPPPSISRCCASHLISHKNRNKRSHVLLWQTGKDLGVDTLLFLSLSDQRHFHQEVHCQVGECIYIISKNGLKSVHKPSRIGYHVWGHAERERESVCVCVHGKVKMSVQISNCNVRRNTWHVLRMWDPRNHRTRPQPQQFQWNMMFPLYSCTARDMATELCCYLYRMNTCMALHKQLKKKRKCSAKHTKRFVFKFKSQNLSQF